MRWHTDGPFHYGKPTPNFEQTSQQFVSSLRAQVKTRSHLAFVSLILLLPEVALGLVNHYLEPR